MTSIQRISKEALNVKRQDAGARVSVARVVLACRKLYFQDIRPDRFLDPAIGDLYPQKDYHRMYIDEIIKCLAKGA